MDPSKTEKATPKRRSELRGKGQVAKSQEFNVAISFFIAVIYLRIYYNDIVSYVVKTTHKLWTTLPTDITPHGFITLFSSLFTGVLFILLPFCLTLIASAVVSNIYQTGWHISFYPLKPNIAKLNPINGVKRFMSPQPFVQLAQNLVKITIFLWIATSILKHHYSTLLLTVHMEISQTGAIIGAVVWEICWKLGLTMLILAILDLIWQRYQFERSMRMSKQEVKDESRNAEGDPQIKSKIRQLQRKAAMQRMMEAIPKADVVLTNPVHLAVVLEYKQDSMSAPKMTAKGAGQVAERIKAIAREHNVPILENKPLARALFRSVEIGDEVPSEFYATISEILVQVYQLTGKIARPQP